MKLYIGNKNYSSWSLRAWLSLKQAGIPFEEVKLRLDFAEGSAFRAALAALAPTSRVPVLVDDGFAVWDSLAIAEYLAEKYPEKRLWPDDPRRRARARSLCAEMHAGFAALREHCPMNVEAQLSAAGATALATVPALRTDLDRIVGMWTELMAAHGGPFLFGDFTVIDAYYAPVCSRIATYALPVPAPVERYIGWMLGLPAMREWRDAALAEHDFLPEDEPYRQRPA